MFDVKIQLLWNVCECVCVCVCVVCVSVCVCAVCVCVTVTASHRKTNFPYHKALFNDVYNLWVGGDSDIVSNITSLRPQFTLQTDPTTGQ